MRLAVLSDTHVPGQADSIPEPFAERVEAADHVVHAGDLAAPDVLADLRERASALTAVHGNADPPDVGLPAVDAVTAEGVAFVVTHGTLNPVEAAVYTTDGTVYTDEDWLNAVADAARARTRAWDGEGVVGIGGHTHRVEDRVHEGVRVLNPGSATGAGPADRPTMLTVDVEDGAVEVTVREA